MLVVEAVGKAIELGQTSLAHTPHTQRLECHDRTEIDDVAVPHGRLDPGAAQRDLCKMTGQCLSSTF